MDALVNSLKLKICGMREPENIDRVSALRPDYMGFIFYEPSPRHVSESSGVSPVLLENLRQKNVTPVAVFVNASIEEVLSVVSAYGFTVVQLHGDEPPEECRLLKDRGLSVIKAFSVATVDDVSRTVAYEGCCDCFLFDTKSPLHGGTGNRFDWSVLQAYSGKTPFFLSGGLDESSVNDILTFFHPSLYGLDVNSRFELAPGLKHVSRLGAFINQLSAN